MTDRGSNLRAAPAELTSDRVERFLALLGAAPRSRPPTPRPIFGVVDHTRRPIPVIGVQNASSAIAFLRSHGVSVKAHAYDLGTRWLVTGELDALDAAAVVALAKRKGFSG